MTDDQHRIGKLAAAALTVAGALERFAGIAPDQRPDAYKIGMTVVQQLQELGWKSPPDPAADIPPLRPARVADDTAREAAMAEIRATLTRPRTT